MTIYTFLQNLLYGKKEKNSIFSFFSGRIFKKFFFRQFLSYETYTMKKFHTEFILLKTKRGLNYTFGKKI